ncbi:MAG: glycerol-3-phosphate 1-O-acyltransferase PlsY [Clostridiales bacterium]|nr:glycerol-3-phosphate 1-O-acyltransferase PlsY [Clostridiales bacterium]
MEIFKLIIGLLMSMAFAYFLGSLNSAILVCRIVKGQDIRKYGSNNAGLTNVLRVYGKGLALATLICDLGKGIIAVTFAKLVVGKLMGVTVLGDELFICYVAAVLVMIGHIFPIYYGFKGGKGVLIGATSLLTVDPLSCILSLLVFAIILYFTKFVSLSSMFAALSFSIFTVLTQWLRGYESYGLNALMVLIMALIIISKHKQNIQRLCDGTENKLSFKSKKK